MADGEHMNVQWRALSDFEWTEKAFHRLTAKKLSYEVSVAGDVISTRVWGPCPRCDGPIDDRQVHTATVIIGPGDRGSETDPTAAPLRIPVDVTCGCGTGHPGAAEGVTGCGVSFRVELTRSDKIGE
ncbi:hypothetical protein JIG36_40525 [Actinoplanes sp. LDG1-06]|uniref:Uncharacterized protein n=1 Tax=Paractinoplanes ovalisporus TaxID=2810368 RepID=A0ABS2APL5_9ACTN|nr:hypothetical protein [Actinoplanes ovalisporus]MBM2621809.1 hypothetical protein [Actinoplanes ovalisporus]